MMPAGVGCALGGKECAVWSSGRQRPNLGGNTNGSVNADGSAFGGLQVLPSGDSS